MSVTCPPEKILNPSTGRCVLRTSTLGKKILDSLPIHLDSIEVVRVIGRGGFGETALIKDTVTGKEYIRKESIRDNEQEMRYQYSILKVLEEKNICKQKFLCPVTKYRDERQRYFIIFDYLKGYKDLDEACTGWSEAKNVKAAKQILSAVRLLHRNGIVHVDIKPNNIMADPITANIRIIDFGTSLVEKTPTTLYSLKGYTSDFVSPDVKKYGFNSFKTLKNNDMWATGLTLCYLLKGYYPNLDSESYRIRADNYLKRTLQTRQSFFSIKPSA